MAQSLEEMVEELTCSICLSLFSTPVTIPCGHNFCSECLELTWTESFTCPQCRFSFPTKPELRKNTLLSNLVTLAQAAQEGVTMPDPEEDRTPAEEEEESEQEEEDDGESSVLCDSCRKHPADKTCLTCMASFCQDHLLPHLQSPAFSDHQLRAPLRDLQQRKCLQHNKLMDHYCWDHGKCLCCYCALGHKACQTATLEEAKSKKELHYTNLLQSLTQKIEKASITAEEVHFEQRKMTENVKERKRFLDGLFEEIQSLMDEERRKTAAKMDEEEKRVLAKFSFTHTVLRKKREEYEGLRGKVQSLLQEQDDLQFLKRSTKMRDTVSKEPFKPRIELDEKLLQNIQRSVMSLKHTVKMRLSNEEESNEGATPSSPRRPNEGGHEKPYRKKEPQEWKSRKTPEPGSAPEAERSNHWKPPPFTKKPNEGGQEKPHKKKEPQEWKSRKTPEPEGSNNWKPPPFSKKSNEGGQEKPHKKNKAKPEPAPLSDPATHPPDAKPRRAPHSSSTPPVPDTREQLLQYAKKLLVNQNTAHKKIAISHGFTRMAVNDVPLNYPDVPERFINCSQVLCALGFSSGIHYWEVEKEEGNFSGLGVAYWSIARSGPESRLGRNKVSWCIEWCNGKLQAWHDDKQTDLTTPNTNKYGVLLNMDEGYVAFYCIGKKCSQIYRFNARFTEAVYPAFWMFSSKTVLSLCQSY